jgi:MFS family permease
MLLAGSLGPTIGPSLGGYLVQEYTWRAMFYLSLPTAVVRFIMTPLVLPKKEKPPRPVFDIWGLASMAVWVVALLLAMSQGQREGWDSTYIRAGCRGGTAARGCPHCGVSGYFCHARDAHPPGLATRPPGTLSAEHRRH